MGLVSIMVIVIFDSSFRNDPYLLVVGMAGKDFFVICREYLRKIGKPQIAAAITN